MAEADPPPKAPPAGGGPDLNPDPRELRQTRGLETPDPEREAELPVDDPPLATPPNDAAGG